jgi:hypothetical protein
VARFDFCLFKDGRFVTNALLTEEEAERMEREGWRCVRVLDEAWQNLPAFRGRRNVTKLRRGRYRWER